MQRVELAIASEVKRIDHCQIMHRKRLKLSLMTSHYLIIESLQHCEH